MPVAKRNKFVAAAKEAVKPSPVVVSVIVHGPKWVPPGYVPELKSPLAGSR